MSNLKAISPKLSNTIIQHVQQAKLVRPVKPHYSYVTLSTHVFTMDMYAGSLNSHSLFTNLP